MLHPAKARVADARAGAARMARGSRPAGDFDAAPLFPRRRSIFGFYNVGTAAHARSWRDAIHRARNATDVDDRRRDDVRRRADRRSLPRGKSVGIEVRRALPPRTSRRACCRRGSAGSRATIRRTGRRPTRSAATLIGPLLRGSSVSSAPRLRAWSRDRNMWVRRASVVGLIPPARKGDALDARLRASRRRCTPTRGSDSEGGRLDAARGRQDRSGAARALSESNVPLIPRTTFRYAIERLSAADRRGS